MPFVGVAGRVAGNAAQGADELVLNALQGIGPGPHEGRAEPWRGPRQRRGGGLPPRIVRGIKGELETAHKYCAIVSRRLDHVPKLLDQSFPGAATRPGGARSNSPGAALINRS